VADASGPREPHGAAGGPELRIDPLTGHRAIIAGARAGRPGAGLRPPPAPPRLDPADDPFAEGNESRTPPEVFAVRIGGGGADTPGWTVRVVPNLYPALAAGGTGGPEPNPDANPDLFWSAPALGAHEVIINSPASVTSLAELPGDQLTAAVEVWRERLRHHYAAGAAYVHLIVNERQEAGASLPHTHAQLYALSFVPSEIARERERFGAYTTRTMGGNLLADLVQEEVRRRERIVEIDDEAVLMAPYGARVPYQLLLAPRAVRPRYEDPGPSGANLIGVALRKLAARFGGATPPLNLWVRTAPAVAGAAHYCWRIDILPRLTHFAGLELGAGVNLNIVSPEQVAAELRDT
jgi:UDPglucose--hexose-1-phosphate uridylyltransferase